MTESQPRPWTPSELRRALEIGHGVVSFPEPSALPAFISGVSTDSRSIQTGALFVALQGARFDGHDHLGDIGERGGAAALVSRRISGVQVPQIVVKDPLVALGDLAAFRRETLTIPVVGITGSSGKTTTKELLKGALAGSERVHATEGNLNNRIGVPLTLLATPADATVVILEMGTSEPGEIEILRKIARPDHVVLTTVAEAHVEGLGGLEGVYEEKLSILNEMVPGGIAVVGDAPEPLAPRALARIEGQGAGTLRVAGMSERASPAWRGRGIGSNSEGGWVVETASGPLSLQVPGAHGAQNALMAWAMAEALGVSFDDARRGIEGVAPHGMRGAVRRVPGGVLLLDCYNANPQSTLAALEWLAQFPAPGRKIAVLGTMLELGRDEAPLHARVLEEVAPLGISRIFATGAFAWAAQARGSDVERGTLVPIADPTAAVETLAEDTQVGDVILLKGSRGIALEGQIPALERALERASDLASQNPDAAGES